MNIKNSFLICLFVSSAIKSADTGTVCLIASPLSTFSAGFAAGQVFGGFVNITYSLLSNPRTEQDVARNAIIRRQGLESIVDGSVLLIASVSMYAMCQDSNK